MTLPGSSGLTETTAGKNTNAKNGWLGQNGLDPIVQQALDAVRVVGNEAVHPGQMDLRDDRATALELFDAINLITDGRATVEAGDRLGQSGSAR